MRSTNLLERFNQELKRRTHIVRIFPNTASCWRLVVALAAKALLAKAIGIAIATGDARGEGIWTGNLGRVELLESRRDDAKEHTERALELALSQRDLGWRATRTTRTTSGTRS